MLKHDEISAKQFMVLALFFTIGNTFIDEPDELTLIAGRDGWIATILGTFIAVGLVWFWVTLQKKFGKTNLIEANEFVFGKVIGKVVSFFFFLYFMVIFLYTIYIFIDFTTLNLLPGVNRVLLGALFMVIVLFVVRKGLGNLARVAELVFPLVALFLVALFVLLLPKADFHFLQPILESGMEPVKKGALNVLGSPFFELVTLMVIFGSVREGTLKNGSFYMGIIWGGFVLVLLNVLSVVVLGVGQTMETAYPSFTLAKTITLGGFLNRVESIVSMAWLISQVIYGALSFYAASYTLAKIFNLTGFRSVTYPLGLVSLVSSTYFIERRLMADMDFWLPYSFTAAFVLPLLLWFWAMIRRKKLNPS